MVKGPDVLETLQLFRFFSPSFFESGKILVFLFQELEEERRIFASRAQEGKRNVFISLYNKMPILIFEFKSESEKQGCFFRFHQNSERENKERQEVNSPPGSDLLKSLREMS